jgi:type II secretory pathway component GspD/PulD (secretin)
MAHPRIFAACALALAALAPSMRAQSAPEPSRAEARLMQMQAPRTIQTVFLKNATEPGEVNDIQTAVRNMLPQVRLFADDSQQAFTISATEDEMPQVLKIIAGLDQPRRLYRLTYTIAEMDGSQRVSERRFILLAAAGKRSDFKQGTRVPVVAGAYPIDKPDLEAQVEYIDVGLTIDATIGGSGDNLSLQTKIEQTSLSDQKPATTIPDPEIRQMVLDVSSILTPGKPQVLGSLDLPGTSHRQQVEVTAELVR